MGVWGSSEFTAERLKRGSLGKQKYECILIRISYKNVSLVLMHVLYVMCQKYVMQVMQLFWARGK